MTLFYLSLIRKKNTQKFVLIRSSFTKIMIGNDRTYDSVDFTVSEFPLMRMTQSNRVIAVECVITVEVDTNSYQKHFCEEKKTNNMIMI